MLTFLWTVEIACWIIIADALLKLSWARRSELVGPLDLLKLE